MGFWTTLTLWQKRSIAGIVGAIAGYAYYYYIGCISGTCPITSNPYISTLYGTVVGALFVNGKKKNKEQEDGNSNPTTTN